MMGQRSQLAGSLKAQYTYFIDIIAEHNGGAIYDSQTSTTDIRHCIFEKVETSGNYNGGAIYKKKGCLDVSYSCFFQCLSGSKTGDQGGNAIYYTASTLHSLIVEYSIIMESAADISNPGDASIEAIYGKLAQFHFLNGTQNFGTMNQGGNILTETYNFLTLNMDYSYITKSKGYRVINTAECSKSQMQHTNIINNTMLYFSQNLQLVEDCYIFRNSIANKPEPKFIDCKSDNTYICSSVYGFATKPLELIMKDDCINQIEGTIKTLLLPKALVALTFSWCDA